jgi:hypothetical protein
MEPIYGYKVKLTAAHESVARMQFLMKSQLVMKKVRMDVLREYYNEYFMDLKSRMAVSTKKLDKQLFASF